MAFRYIVKSTERKDDILLLTLAPKRESRHLTFEPGQYAAIGFKHGLRPTPMRCFSIVSSPSNNVLQFALRVKGEFTQSATKLRPGNMVRVLGPYGDFTLNPEYDRNVVMLAGGIGITPFLSMIRDATERQLNLQMTLWYSNKYSARIPFYGQIKSLAEHNAFFRAHFFSADTEGKVTDQHLLSLQATSPDGTTYFICGPRRFSESMQSTLLAAGVQESRIVSESFTQSSKITLDSGFSISTLTYVFSAAMLLLFTGAIMLLDLHQNLSRLVSAQTTSPSQAVNSSSTSKSTNDKTSSNVSRSTQSQTPTTPQNTQPNYSYYQQPVSSVS